MRSQRRLLVGLLVAGCASPLPGPMRAQQIYPGVPYVPQSAYEWPLERTVDGWLVGGSGYTTGGFGPWGITPGLGLGAILFPSRLPGSWLGFGGDHPPPPVPFFPGPFPVWTGSDAAAAHASDYTAGPYPVALPSLPDPSSSDRTVTTTPATAGFGPDGRGSVVVPSVSGLSTQASLARWTKIALTFLPAPVVTVWPEAPFHLSPWGPVVYRPGPTPSPSPVVPLGFPPADGTPVSQGNFLALLRRYRGISDVVLYDFVTRALHVPPSAIMPFQDVFGTTTREGLLLIARPDALGTLKLIDLLTGGIDPLPELNDATSDLNGNLSWKGEFISYTVGTGTNRRVRLFDRRTRLVDPLARLNADTENFAPAVALQGRILAFVTTRNGNPDIAIYDTITGLFDPLRGVNTSAAETVPNISDSAQFLVYITDASGRPAARLYNRATGGIDTLPELNSLGPIANVNITTDGLFIYAAVLIAGRTKVVIYARPSGFIDPLPAVNLPGADVTF
ncbi:MAG: hypothetical protein H7338_00905 [Candidatus Sericytochromatia bacterium]|nr:hypothetical protein [Candidatus Sericytochromatia bacterium]